MSTSNLETLRARNRRAATAMVVASSLPPGLIIGALFFFGLGSALPDLQQLLFGGSTR